MKVSVEIKLTKGRIFCILLLLLFSYLPIICLLYFGLFNNIINLNIKTAVFLLSALLIRSLGINLIMQILPFDYKYLDEDDEYNNGY